MSAPPLTTLEARKGAALAWSAQVPGTVSALAFGGAPARTTGALDLHGPLLVAAVAGSNLALASASVSHAVGEPGVMLAAFDATTGAPRGGLAFQSSEWVTVTSMTLTSDGLVVGGAFSGTLRIGDNIVSTAGRSDGYVARIGATAADTWIVRLGGPGADAIQGVAAREGRIAIAGTFAGGADLLGHSLVAFDERLPFADVFVAALDPHGGYLWSSSFGGKLDDAVAGVALDHNGRVAVAATVRETVHVAGLDLTAQGDADGLVAWFSKDGAALHAVLLGGPDFDGLRAITSVDDHLVVAGFFSGSILLGNHTLKAGGGDDSFLAAFDARDSLVAAWPVTGPGREEITSLGHVPGGFLAGVSHTAALTVEGGPGAPAPADPLSGAALVVRPLR